MNLLSPVFRSTDSIRVEVTTEGRRVDWAPLYLAAAAAALLIVAFTVIQVIVFLASPPPDTVLGWFKLFHRNALLGLLDMDLLMIADVVLSTIVTLALVVVLWRVAPGLMALAGALGLLGAATFFASNPAFSMLALSNKYWNATTDAQRAAFLAAGEAMKSTWNGSAYLVFYELGAVTVLIIGFVMLRSTVFSRTTALIGLATGVLMLWPPVNTVLIVVSLLSLLPMAIWYVLVALRLIRIARGDPGTGGVA